MRNGWNLTLLRTMDRLIMDWIKRQEASKGTDTNNNNNKKPLNSSAHKTLDMKEMWNLNKPSEC